MPVDQLNTHPESTYPLDTAGALHRAVLAVLGGAASAEAAASIGRTPASLEAAVEVFCRAGRQALNEQSEWWQLYVEFTRWEHAEQAAAEYLAPLLSRLETGQRSMWWFIRKHPCWRLRLHTRDQAMETAVADTLDAMAAAGHVRRWWTGIYEPETPAFGGTEAMRAAHRLFHADSRAVLELPRQSRSALGRRELSILLCVAFMRAAGLEWYEQADAWSRVADERPIPESASPERLHGLAEDVRVLLLADTDPSGGMFGPGGPAEPAAPWAEAFRTAGRTLGSACRSGTLERGLRQVVAYNIIFHWNRLGLPHTTQSALARAAKAAVLTAG